MANHVLRLYALAATIAVFFLSWAAIAARPWRGEPAATVEPAAAVASGAPVSDALSAEKKRLRRKAARLERLLAAGRAAPVNPISAQSAPQPVAVTSAPPVTQTRSS